jgi:molecular chaperone DnaK (HSP70)
MAQQPTQQPTPAAVGIDLGSFQSVIAVTQKNGIEVLSN